MLRKDSHCVVNGRAQGPIGLHGAFLRALHCSSYVSKEVLLDECIVKPKLLFASGQFQRELFSPHQLRIDRRNIIGPVNNFSSELAYDVSFAKTGTVKEGSLGDAQDGVAPRYFAKLHFPPQAMEVSQGRVELSSTHDLPAFTQNSVGLLC